MRPARTCCLNTGNFGIFFPQNLAARSPLATSQKSFVRVASYKPFTFLATCPEVKSGKFFTQKIINKNWQLRNQKKSFSHFGKKELPTG